MTSSSTRIDCLNWLCRISYVFGLKGPCVSVDTACSSSLVASHYSVSDLTSGKCEMSLAAGVNLTLTPQRSSAFTITGVLHGCELHGH